MTNMRLCGASEILQIETPLGRNKSRGDGYSFIKMDPDTAGSPTKIRTAD